MFLNIPKPPPRSVAGDGRPLSEIARQPRFLVAVACGVASYAMMNLVMTSAPLAMVMCNHTVTQAALGLQWHVLGMYAPSFITGTLISRFGIERVTGMGLALIIVAAMIGIAGISLWHFWIGLALLGVGWNFAFIGATTMVTLCHRPNERNKVQAFNDFLVFGSMAIGSFSSGQLLAGFGWTHGERGRIPRGAGGGRAAALGRATRAHARPSDAERDTNERPAARAISRAGGGEQRLPNEGLNLVRPCEKFHLLREHVAGPPHPKRALSTVRKPGNALGRERRP